jgi:rubrerythrin
MEQESDAATAIAAVAQPEWREVRVRVRGGPVGERDFAGALSFHVEASERGFTIVQTDARYTCANCDAEYAAASATEPCPVCGGGAWPEYAPEEIQIEFTGGAARGRVA